MIILNSQDNLEYLKSLIEKFPQTFEMTTCTSTSDVNHFIVCDSRMIRIEELHPPLDTSDATDEMVKAKVNFNDPLRAKHHMGLFDAIWQALTAPKVVPLPAK